ncbi:hypothetical protein PR003_g28591 [Phytophthora rubi]|uniref:Uncharacterized protein n=1 Tax=Phytophthora rubi TaxID=129364 RepID=A0A6A4BPE7_9STRA|nr:hypothetical protein PR003_g28591 [Phytophthora rubi]
MTNSVSTSQKYGRFGRATRAFKRSNCKLVWTYVEIQITLEFVLPEVGVVNDDNIDASVQVALQCFAALRVACFMRFMESAPIEHVAPPRWKNLSAEQISVRKPT